MIIDNIIIKLLLNKDLYNKYNKFINLDFYKNNNREVFKILLSLFKLHETHEGDVSIQDLTVFFYTQYPLLANKPDEKHLIDSTLASVAEVEVSDDVAIEYLTKHRNQALATEFAIKFLEVANGKEELGTVLGMLNASDLNVEVDASDDFVSDDLLLLTDNLIASEGLRWRLNTLNKSLGSLRKGDFGFLFARPETGKTTILASEVTYMAIQAREKGLGPVLWLNNEEQGSKVMLRCYQAYFGVTLNDLYTHLDYYKEEYEKALGGFIKIYDNPKIRKADIERLCKELNPSLIICDQIDKIAWPDGERYDLKMKAIYQFARELAKTYAPFIGICQAGGTAEGKKYLDMNDVDSSHTAKQGEADFMIGLGKTNIDGEEFLRYISLCKNKLTGDSDTNPELRHAKMPIRILPDVARYEDMLNL